MKLILSWVLLDDHVSFLMYVFVLSVHNSA